MAVQNEEDHMEPLQVHFLGMPKSEAIEGKVRERGEHLSRFSPDVQKCEVWVASTRGHHRKGNLYEIRIRLTIPGNEIDVVQQPAEEDVYVAIRQSFAAAGRRLEDVERRQRGEVKAHPRAKGDRTRRRQIAPRGERA
jgi:ribosome-associated translation inhibitor RaiA